MHRGIGHEPCIYESIDAKFVTFFSERKVNTLDDPLSNFLIKKRCRSESRISHNRRRDIVQGSTCTSPSMTVVLRLSYFSEELNFANPAVKRMLKASENHKEIENGTESYS